MRFSGSFLKPTFEIYISCICHHKHMWAKKFSNLSTLISIYYNFQYMKGVSKSNKTEGKLCFEAQIFRKIKFKKNK